MNPFVIFNYLPHDHYQNGFMLDYEIAVFQLRGLLIRIYNGVLGRMWKELVTIYFKLLLHLLARIEDNFKPSFLDAWSLG
jgi:hypothetical protein